MTLSEHLEELRTRVIRALVIASVGVAICAFFQEELVAVVLWPVMNVLKQHDIGTVLVPSITAAFMTSMKIVVVAGLFFTGPLVLRELWLFVASGLYQKEKRSIQLAAPISYVLFVIGALFFYFLLQPFVLNELLTWQIELQPLSAGEDPVKLEVMPTIDSVWTFFLSMSLVMGVIFQLPLVMVVLQKIGLVDHRSFARYRRHFIMGSVVAAAVVTPTGDALTLGATMVPIVLLFESGILVCRFIAPKDELAPVSTGD